jgi:hypothetical protein
MVRAGAGSRCSVWASVDDPDAWLVEEMAERRRADLHREYTPCGPLPARARDWQTRTNIVRTERYTAS